MAIKIDTSAVQASLAGLPQRARANAERGGAILAADMENYGKQNRPWQDRTGNARASIAGVSKLDGDILSVTILIGVYYGIFLELANAGKYRIILPTRDAHRGEFRRIVESLV
jgi:hypothetical protein